MQVHGFGHPSSLRFPPGPSLLASASAAAAGGEPPDFRYATVAGTGQVDAPPQAHLSRKGVAQRRTAGRGAAVSHPSYITTLIKHSRSLWALQHTLSTHLPALNALHASAALTHAAQLLHGRGPGFTNDSRDPGSSEPQGLPVELAQLLVELQRQHLHSFGARQASNSMWALARLQAQLRENVLPLFQALMARLHAHIQDAQPQVRPEYV